MAKQKITVIVPIYNVEAYLAQCLDSLVAQTIPLQVIMVNDGSQDTSGSIAQTYVQQYPTIFTYIEQKNQGLSAARNTGIKQVKTPYVAFMDSDDWVSVDYYEQLLEVLEKTAADIVCSDITFTYENGKEKCKPGQTISTTLSEIELNSDLDRRYILDVFPMAQNKLWRTAFLQKHDLFFLSGFQYEDLDFFYRSFVHMRKIAFTTKGIFYYRQRAESIVKTANKKILDIMGIFDNVIQYYHAIGQWDNYQQEIEYLLVRNCLVASSKRIAYSRNYQFIHSMLKALYAYVEENVPEWKKNIFLQSRTLRHCYLRFFNKVTLPFYSAFLYVLGLFIN